MKSKIINIGDKVCLSCEKFKFIYYNQQSNLFDCSTSLKDKPSKYHTHSQTLRLNRFSLPGNFSGLQVQTEEEWYIPEAIGKLGFEGRILPGDHFKIVDEQGNKYTIEEDWDFEKTGLYKYMPENHGGPAIIKTGEKRTKRVQPGHNLVGNEWYGNNIRGTVDRIISFFYKSIKEDDMVRTKHRLQYHNSHPTDIYTHKRIVEAILIDEDYMASTILL